MPVRKQDTQRALYLLEEYRSKLSQNEDRQLRNSIERVINIFQSNLFQALIGRNKHLKDLHQAFLKLRYPPKEVRKQIDQARRVPRSLLLQDRLNKENNRIPLAITYNPQLIPLQCIISDLQPVLDNDPSLSQTLGGRPVLSYRQPTNLKQILTSN